VFLELKRKCYKQEIVRIDIFTFLVVKKSAIIVAHHFAFGKLMHCFHSSAVARQIVNRLNTFPGFQPNPFAD